MSKVGMIILNYNDYETTEKYLKEIKNYKVLDRIIVVDNKSTDSSYEKLQKYNSYKIKVIETKKNNGYAYGNNVGIRALDDDIDYVIISNPDITVSEKTISRLKKDLDTNSDISVIAPVIHELDYIKRGWRLPKYKDELLSNINYFHKKAEANLKYDDSKYKGNITKVDVVSGCFFMVRKEVLNLIGNFDEGTFLYYEENIMGHKLNTIGKKTFIDNDAHITHNLSVSVDKSFNSINKYKILKNSQKYYVKYFLKSNIFAIILLRLVYYISLGLAYVVCFFRNIRSKKK